MKKRYIFLPPLLLITVVYGILLMVPPAYTYHPFIEGDFDTFEDYYAALQKNSEENEARPANEERFINKGEKTDIAFLYVHGFTATRGEGEIVLEELANRYHANTLLLRLPGHGTNPEQHRATKYTEYLDYAIQALKMIQERGEKVVIVGSSMGGLITTYLAATYPDLVDGVILASPFYDYASPEAASLKIPGALDAFIMMNGEIRKFSKDENWESRKGPRYDDFWYRKQYVRTFQSLEDLRAYASNSNTFTSVKCPALGFYYYKDAENQDGASSVVAIKKAFELFSTPDDQKKLVQIEDGEHILLSEHVRTDKEKILNECYQFLDEHLAN